MLSVKEVYNKIAHHFDSSRQRVWGSVRGFLDSLPANSKILDNGCGNGKNMLYRKDLDIIGIDNSSEQVKICKNKGLDVKEADMVDLPFDTGTFDNILCIATYHHLDNDISRKKSLSEMHRCLKVGGTAILMVWSMRQYEGSPFTFTKSDEMVSWKNTDGIVYMRYYHIYSEGELESEIERLCPSLTIVKKGWELGNWFVILEKA